MMENVNSSATQTFTACRSRLLGIAYRMLGARAEAEDVVQDAWFKWREADPTELKSAEAWLVTVVTRLSIDRLRAARIQREHYSGIWLPEPWVEQTSPAPDDMLELADNASMAFLSLLERLTPEERAAFLMREVFDADYADVARMLDKSEAACRQLVSRAKSHVQLEKPRFEVSRETHARLVRKFADAAGRGDLDALRGLFSEEAALIGDGGGVVPSFGKILYGADRLARLYYAVHLRLSRTSHAKMRLEVADVNGETGLLRWMGDVLESVQTFETDGERIVRVHVQRNPLKLARVGTPAAVTTT